MDESCTVYNVFDIVAKRWSLLIILSLSRCDGKKRYSEIKKDINNITPKILSARLRELELQGLIRKEIDSSSVPVKTFYHLTDSGSDLFGIIQNLKRWGLKWNLENEECKKRSCSNCRIPLDDCASHSI